MQLPRVPRLKNLAYVAVNTVPHGLARWSFFCSLTPSFISDVRFSVHTYIHTVFAVESHQLHGTGSFSPVILDLAGDYCKILAL